MNAAESCLVEEAHPATKIPQTARELNPSWLRPRGGRRAALGVERIPHRSCSSSPPVELPQEPLGSVVRWPASGDGGGLFSPVRL